MFVYISICSDREAALWFVLQEASFHRLLPEPEQYGFTFAVERRTLTLALAGKFDFQMRDKCRCSSAARLTVVHTQRKHEAGRQDSASGGT